MIKTLSKKEAQTLSIKLSLVAVIIGLACAVSTYNISESRIDSKLTLLKAAAEHTAGIVSRENQVFNVSSNEKLF
ncbi:hypothetical protein [Vibrio parahaemolyticus]|uniref:hypothetical protein n=1 Tax=Vibrio parahaemolyticus TaxID=670 RepID=UPI0004D3CB94|nr:hypothetical protein [Vibrio parahaemolyticus]EKZ9227192.1 hypothetical protein [Vibrio parahaemolyticus]OQT76745.1 hypothetical protein EM98_019445 [Vibrio parahaemolyticus]